MLKRIGFPLIFFILAAVIQVTFVPLLSFNLIGPDFVTIVLVFYTLKNGQLFGTLCGFIFGFLFDLISGGILGSAMFSKTITGFFAGYFFNENKIDYYLSSFIFIGLVFLAGTLDAIVYTFIYSNEMLSNFTALFFMRGLLPGAFTAVVSLPVIIFYPKHRLA